MRLNLPTTALIAVLAGTLSAWAEGDAEAGDPEAGAAAYDRDCARCHRDSDALAAQVAKAEDPAAMLDSFLARHRAPDPVQRADIIAFLLTPR